MSSYTANKGTSLERLIEAARVLHSSGEMKVIELKFPDLVQKIVAVDNTLNLHGVHEAYNFPVNDILQTLNMAEQELEINRMNEFTLSRVAANDAMTESFAEADNVGVLGYDNSPEVVALGVQWQRDQHRKFLEAHGGERKTTN